MKIKLSCILIVSVILSMFLSVTSFAGSLDSIQFSKEDTDVNNDVDDDEVYYASEKTTIRGKDYIFDENDQKITDHWVELDDYFCYYCQSDGTVAKNKWIDDYYYVDGEGRLVLFLDDVGTYDIESISMGDEYYTADELSGGEFSDFYIEVTDEGTVILYSSDSTTECVIDGLTIIENNKYVYPFYVDGGYATIVIEGDDDDSTDDDIYIDFVMN